MIKASLETHYLLRGNAPDGGKTTEIRLLPELSLVKWDKTKTAPMNQYGIFFGWICFGIVFSFYFRESKNG